MSPLQYQLAAKVAGVLVLMVAAAGVVWWGMAPPVSYTHLTLPTTPYV